MTVFAAIILEDNQFYLKGLEATLGGGNCFMLWRFSLSSSSWAITHVGSLPLEWQLRVLKPLRKFGTS